MRFIQAVIFLAFLVTIGIFAVQNRNVITVNFLTWNLSQPVAIVTVAVYVLGMLSGWTVLTLAAVRSTRSRYAHGIEPQATGLTHESNAGGERNSVPLQAPGGPASAH